MTLGVFLSLGESLAGLRRTGQDARFIKEYLRRYAERFDRVLVFSYADERADLPAGVELVPNRFRVHRFIYAFLLPFLAWRQVRRCDVIRVMQTPGAIPARLTAWMHRRPYVVTYGYEYERLARYEGKPLRAWLLARLIGPLLRGAARVIVTSAARLADLQARGITSVILIPNGVNLEQFAPAPKPPVRPTLLYVGRLGREKNLDLLLEAVAESSFRTSVLVRFVGSGPERNALQARAAGCGVALEILPPRPHHELPALYQSATVFALLSVSEGHPKVLLEAFASGLPCLVSPAVALAAGVRDGVHALTVEPTAGLVRSALERLLGDPALRLHLGVAARALAARDFDLRSTLKRELDLLTSYVHPTPVRA